MTRILHNHTFQRVCLVAILKLPSSKRRLPLLERLRYRFSRCKPWSTRKRQTGTCVFSLLFVGRFNNKKLQHLIQSFQQSTEWRTSTGESYHTLIGFLTPEYLGFLKLQVVPRFTGTCISPVPVNWNRGILISLIFAPLVRAKRLQWKIALKPTLCTVQMSHDFRLPYTHGKVYII